MKILITGATGFIGQHLLEKLNASDHELHVMSRKISPAFHVPAERIHIHKADLANESELNSAMNGIDLVFNLAAEIKDSVNFERTNILGIENLIKACKGNNVKRIIHLSSVGVSGVQYSGTELIVDEQTPCHPKNEYERTKLISEKLLKEAFGKEKNKLVILRPTNVFGEHHPRQALLRYLRTVKSGRRIIAQKDAMLNYVYVRDLVAAMEYFIGNENAFPVYNIGHSTPVKEMMQICANALKTDLRLSTVPSFILKSPAIVGYFGSSRIKNVLRTLSNRVEYSDDLYIKENHSAYPFGLKIGLENTIADYIAKGIL